MNLNPLTTCLSPQQVKDMWFFHTVLLILCPADWSNPSLSRLQVRSYHTSSWKLKNFKSFLQLSGSSITLPVTHCSDDLRTEGRLSSNCDIFFKLQMSSELVIDCVHLSLYSSCTWEAVLTPMQPNQMQHKNSEVGPGFVQEPQGVTWPLREIKQHQTAFCYSPFCCYQILRADSR